MNKILKDLVVGILAGTIVSVGTWLIGNKFFGIPVAALYGLVAGVLITVAVVAAISYSRKTEAPRAVEPQIRFLKNNVEMMKDIQALFPENDERVRRVFVIQYSGRNVKDLIAHLADCPNADIEMFVKDPKNAINERQKRRIWETLNELRQNEISAKARLRGNVHLYTYDAPGAIRAVLIEGQVLYAGCFLYKVEEVSAPDFDIRGGEISLMAIPAGHPKFKIMSDEIHTMIRNWIDHKRATPHDSGQKAKA